MLKNLLLIFIVFFACDSAFADDVYLAPDKFVSQAFDNSPPEPQVLWIKKEWQEDIKTIMGSHYKILRTRYWEKEGCTAWILEEIGKVRPITTGFIVDSDDKLKEVKVLIYRESHGWEVKHSFFTDQFKDIELNSDNSYKLSKNIDGISGATLSVDALERLSRLALYLHKKVNEV